MKMPVVLSDNSNTHSPLGRGNKLPTNVIPVSTESDNTLTMKPDGLFIQQEHGLSAINHDYSLGGSGSQGDPLLIRVSNLNENVLQMRQQEDSNGGLYFPENAILQSVAHNNSLNGNGNSDDKLCVRISNKVGNSLQLVDAAPANGGGLYVMQKNAPQRADITNPIICDGPDDLSAEYACGKLGNGVYWKKKVVLTKAKYGDNNILVYPYLTTIPCKSDGSPVPYQLLVNYPLIQSGETPYVYLLLICSEVPTHTFSLTDRYKREIRRGIAITTPTGLDDVYGVSNPGSGPYYTLHYMYSA